MMNFVIMVITIAMIIIWDVPFSNKAKLLPLFYFFNGVTGDLNFSCCGTQKIPSWKYDGDFANT